MNPKASARILCYGLLVLALACGSAAYHKGEYLLDKRQYDDAADQLDKAMKENPKNLKYRTEAIRARMKASQTHMDQAQMALGREDYASAATHYQKALQFDPSNQYAKDQLQKVVQLAAQKELNERQAATTIDQMKEASREDTGVPKLDPASNIPVVLKFSDTPLKTILDAVSKASGVNFLYDDKAETTKRVSVDFAKVNLSQVMDYLMMQSKNFYKVLDPHTLMIIPDTKQKHDEYADQVIRTFYLSNADAKDVFQLVRSILQARKMAMNQDLNSITIQDTPDVVAICQHIIEDNDKSKGEVAVDVELLEVDGSLTRNLGINLTDTTFTIGPKHNLVTDSSGNKSIGHGPPVPLNEFGKILTQSLYVSPIPNLIAELLLTSSGSQILAKPQLRVMEGQKAMVHIGDKWPIPTANLYNQTGGTGTNYTPITSYTYQDIGVKIEIEPKVHHNREITIKLKVEVSSISGNVKGNGTTPDQPIIGTRESNSVIRLEDGETSMMAGLISKEDRTSLTGLPGISEIPILRRLFSNTQDDVKKTDVVMLLTPHIIRMPNITEGDLKPLWVGTADNPKLKGDPATTWAPSPFATGAQPPAAQPGKGALIPGAAKAGTDGAKPAAADAPKPAPGASKPEATAAPAPAEAHAEKSGSAAPASASSARLMLSPANLTTRAGESVVLNLVLVGAQEMKGLHLELDFPSDTLAFQGADEGTFFKLGGGTASFKAQEMKPGSVSVDMGRADGASSGSGLTGRLRFAASKSGLAKVNVGVAQAQPATGQSYALSPTAAMVSVAEAQPAPAPAPDQAAPAPAPAPPQPAPADPAPPKGEDDD